MISFSKMPTEISKFIFQFSFFVNSRNAFFNFSTAEMFASEKCFQRLDKFKTPKQN